MARKRYSDEDCLKILRQVELDLAGGADVAKACRTAGRGVKMSQKSSAPPTRVPAGSRLSADHHRSSG